MAKKDEKKLKANPPDMDYCEYCRVLFASDPEVEVSDMDLDIREFTITVSELNKFLLISKLLNGLHVEGNMRWSVKVQLAENYKVVDKPLKPAEIVFRGNANFDRVIRIEGAMMDIDVVVFKPVIVQPHVDDWSNPDGGIVSYTYQQLANLVFKDFPQATFTTSALEKKPAAKKRR